MRSKNAFKNIFSNLFLQFIIVIYGFIVPRIIIIHYGSNVNGMITSITHFLAYISLLEAGMGAVIKAALYKPLSQKNKSEVENIVFSSQKFFKKLSIVFIIYCLVLCLLYPIFIKTSFNNIFTVSMILIIAISTFAEYFFGLTYRLLLSSNQQNYIVSSIGILVYITNIVVCILLSLTNCSIIVLKLVTSIIFVLRPIIQNLYVKKHFKLDFKNVDNKYVLNDKWDGMSLHIATVIHNNTDTVVLSLFSNLINVSIYSVYAMVLTGIKSFVMIFANNVETIFGDMIAKKEKENLKIKFNIYENLHFIITTILFSVTIVLIVPFVKIYTKGFNDANYINVWFSILIVFGEYFWSLRLPYNNIIKAAGKFKDIMIGGWIEAAINILISIILVIKFGLVGVAIGTVISIFIRMIEFIIKSNNSVLERSFAISMKKLALFSLLLPLNIFISNKVIIISDVTIISFLLFSILYIFICGLECLLIMTIFYRRDLIVLWNYFIKKNKNI